MRKILGDVVRGCALSCAAAFAGAGSVQAQTPARAELIRAELAFARAAEESGVRDAFLEYLADDAVLFRPRAVPGKEWTRARPASPALLTWYPTFADVSAAGDLGYTTGPYRLRPGGARDTLVGHGTFMSLWRRQSDGAWRVVLDAGIAHAAPADSAPVADAGADAVAVDAATDALAVEKPRARPAVGPGRARALAEIEARLAQASPGRTFAEGLAGWLDPSARLLRDGRPPVMGRDSVLAALGGLDGGAVWRTGRTEVAESGDLGYSYGEFSLGAPGTKAEAGMYVRIWRRAADGPWRLVLLQLAPLPAR